MCYISQNPFYLCSVQRTSVSGEHFRANGPLVLNMQEEAFQNKVEKGKKCWSLILFVFLNTFETDLFPYHTVPTFNDL